MNWMIGRHFDLNSILRLAGTLGVTSGGKLQLPLTAEDDVRTWQRLRSEAYEVLVFDGPTVAGQAVLSKAIATALDGGHLDLVDWHYNDQKLLNALMEWPATRKQLQSDFYNELPTLCFLHVAREGLERLNSIGRGPMVALIEEFLHNRYGPKVRAYGYVFRDRGTFEKRVEFLDTSTGRTWSIGKPSASLVLYGFVKRPSRRDSNSEQLGREFIEWADSRL